MKSKLFLFLLSFMIIHYLKGVQEKKSLLKLLIEKNYEKSLHDAYKGIEKIPKNQTNLNFKNRKNLLFRKLKSLVNPNILLKRVKLKDPRKLAAHLVEKQEYPYLQNLNFFNFVKNGPDNENVNVEVPKNDFDGKLTNSFAFLYPKMANNNISLDSEDLLSNTADFYPTQITKIAPQEDSNPILESLIKPEITVSKLSNENHDHLDHDHSILTAEHHVMNPEEDHHVIIQHHTITPKNNNFLNMLFGNLDLDDSHPLEVSHIDNHHLEVSHVDDHPLNSFLHDNIHSLEVGHVDDHPLNSFLHNIDPKEVKTNLPLDHPLNSLLHYDSKENNNLDFNVTPENIHILNGGISDEDTNNINNTVHHHQISVHLHPQSDEEQDLIKNLQDLHNNNEEDPFKNHIDLRNTPTDHPLKTIGKIHDLIASLPAKYRDSVHFASKSNEEHFKSPDLIQHTKSLSRHSEDDDQISFKLNALDNPQNHEQDLLQNIPNIDEGLEDESNRRGRNFDFDTSSEENHHIDLKNQTTHSHYSEEHEEIPNILTNIPNHSTQSFENNEDNQKKSDLPIVLISNTEEKSISDENDRTSEKGPKNETIDITIHPDELDDSSDPNIDQMLKTLKNKSPNNQDPNNEDLIQDPNNQDFNIEDPNNQNPNGQPAKIYNYS